MEEFYTKIGGNYNETKNRLIREDLIRRFVCQFPQDPSFGQLEESLNASDLKNAFNAIHTLKGVSLNLGFDRLSNRAVLLTDALRENRRDSVTSAQLQELFNAVKESYLEVLQAIGQLPKA